MVEEYQDYFVPEKLQEIQFAIDSYQPPQTKVREFIHVNRDWVALCLNLHYLPVQIHLYVDGDFIQGARADRNFGVKWTRTFKEPPNKVPSLEELERQHKVKFVFTGGGQKEQQIRDSIGTRLVAKLACDLGLANLERDKSKLMAEFDHVLDIALNESFITPILRRCTTKCGDTVQVSLGNFRTWWPISAMSLA